MLEETEQYVFLKTYAAEELPSIEQDISDAFLNTENTKNIPVGEDGFETGSFIVSVVWRSDDWCGCTGFRHRHNCPNASKDICF